MPNRPLLALTVGDPAGIGPEIVARALADTRIPSKLRILAIGPGVCRPPRVPVFDPNKDTNTIADRAWLITGGERDWDFGSAQASAGRAALIALRAGHELALARYVDGLVCGPVSKEALTLAGERVEGQTELLGRWANAPGVQMLGLARELRVLLLSRHLPLRQALELITQQRVLEHLVMLDEGLQRLGFPRPRLALAGLNPHAGENGILGTEEHDLLQPALELAQRAGVRVVGPLSPDTVFLRAAQGEFDGVLALYHDQAFIPLKLHAPGEGLTVLLRFPYLRVSPAHGTAFDIAGQNRADPRNLIVALEAAARFAPSYLAAASAARS